MNKLNSINWLTFFLKESLLNDFYKIQKDLISWYHLLWNRKKSLEGNLTAIPHPLHSFTAWKVSVFGIFLVRIFSHSDWMWRDTEYLSVFSPNPRKKGLEKLRIRTLFTQCLSFPEGLVFSNLSSLFKYCKFLSF